MAAFPAPSTAAPRRRSGRSGRPRAASRCLPAARACRRCLASSRRHRRARFSKLAGALVGGREVDGGARSDVGASRSPQIGSMSRPRWPATSLHLGGFELDHLCTLAIILARAPSAARARRPPLHPRPDAPRALLEPAQKQTRAHPASEERSRTSLADLLRSYPARPLSPHASAGHITTRDGSGGAL